jgi:hypothetical protein
MPVRSTIADQDLQVVLYDLSNEFVHKTRLADAGFANDVEYVGTVADRVEAALQVR